LAAFIDRWNGQGAWEKLPIKSRAYFVGIAEAVADGYGSLLSKPTTLGDIRGLSVPTLIMCGATTTTSDRRISEILRDTIPDCRYATIPGAAHMSPLTHPNEVATLLLEQLSGLT
jgi:pimeloyl-ACP methyl ester carboxylesterase